MMSYTRPNNRGQLAGRVQSVDGQTFTIKPSLDLAAGDILEVWTRAGNFTCTVDTAALASFGSATAGAKSGKASKTGKNGKASQKGQKGRNSKGGYTLELATPSGAKSPSVGDRVFRVRSADAVFVSDALAPKVPVYGRVSLKIGEPLFVEFSAYGTDGELLGCESCTGDVVEPARSREVAKEDVYAHIDRLGQTSFELVDLQIDLDPGVGIGFSALHHIRQDALAALEDCLVAARTRESAAVARAKLCEGETKGRKRAKKNNEGEVVPNADALEVCALVANPQCARAARRTGAEVYVAAVNFARGTAQMCGAVCEDVAQAGYPSRAKIVLPVADHDAIEGTREAALGIDLRQYMSGAAAVVAQNLGQLANAATEGLPCEVGPNLPVTNVSAYELMASLGARCVWLSPEMTLAQVRDLLAGIRSADCQGAHGVGNTAIDKNNSEHGISCMPAAGIFVAGRLCLMTTEHCELMSAGPCNEDCSKCVRRRGRYALRDRKGYEFPVVSDRLGRSSIYNAVPLDIAHALPDLVRVGITRFMVDSTLMSPEETAQACGRVAKAIELYRKGEEPLPKSGNATTGHLFRQVD
jgi:putative protease